MAKRLHFITDMKKKRIVPQNQPNYRSSERPDTLESEPATPQTSESVPSSETEQASQQNRSIEANQGETNEGPDTFKVNQPPIPGRPASQGERA